MQQDNTRQKTFQRRTIVLVGGQLTLFGVLIARMYQLQVVESAKYQTLAEENRISMRVLAPQRGRVLDRFGEQIAYNDINYRVVVIPEQTGNVATTLDVLSNIVPLRDQERERILREVRRKRRFVPILIKEGLSWDDVAKIAVNAVDLPGVIVDMGYSRQYPFGAEFAHVVGYVAPPATRDLTGDPVLELPGFRVGREGLERSFELALRGRGGTAQFEVNALGRPIRELNRDEGDAGQDLVLTIDRELQKFTMDRLAGEESAAAVLMEVRTGEVLASASVPSFDPNPFNRGITDAYYRSLITNRRGPLNNKAISGQFAPGSTFKIVTTLAALESGAVSQDFRFSCPGHMDFGDNRFHCWKRGGHGGIDMVNAIQQSCDVYFYEVARRVGIDTIAVMSRRLGLGQHLLSEGLPGERAGLIPTREWKQATIGQAWAQGETLVAGIGQGFVLTTPLQLAVMTARVVTGTAVLPRFTRDALAGRRLVARPEQTFAPLGLSRNSLSMVMRGMNGVVNDPRGTAFRMRTTEPGTLFGGKTGTSQVRRITEEERIRGLRPPDKVPWAERDHAVFIGFAPIEAPRYACGVVVEHGGGGSAVAAPIARDILVEAIKRERSRPQPLQRLARQ